MNIIFLFCFAFNIQSVANPIASDFIKPLFHTPSPCSSATDPFRFFVCLFVCLTSHWLLRLRSWCLPPALSLVHLTHRCQAHLISVAIMPLPGVRHCLWDSLVLLWQSYFPLCFCVSLAPDAPARLSMPPRGGLWLCAHCSVRVPLSHAPSCPHASIRSG